MIDPFTPAAESLAPSGYPNAPDQLPRGVITAGRYRARFASTHSDLDAILKLRFEVFNLELGEGLASSYETGRDEDVFDRHCHHLLVEDEKNGGKVVGTYRMQTSEMAARSGFYSATEFDFSTLPPEVLADGVEVGRACISREHRNRMILFLLWKGLARYLSTNRKRFLFGCCSLTSQDPCDGARALRHLTAEGHLHPTVLVQPRPGFECACPGALPEEPEPFEIPMLFKTYLRYGALACGPAALDREFGTIDFFVLFDLATLDADTYRVFFDEQR
ncbi:MAG: GNAT family N-acyltransferase [Thermoanaerobaculia bacterium]